RPALSRDPVGDRSAHLSPLGAPQPRTSSRRHSALASGATVRVDDTARGAGCLWSGERPALPGRRGPQQRALVRRRGPGAAPLWPFAPGWRVAIRAAPWTGPTAGLASGGTDVALLRLPFPGQDSLRTKVPFTEPRWAALPPHPLARRDVIAFRGEPFVTPPAGLH